MKKLFLAICLFTTALFTTIETKAQNIPAEIRNVPPSVQATWAYMMQTVYMEKYGRYGITTWYMDKGIFMSITVFRRSSEFVRLFMRYTPQGELLSAETDE